jgi:hypothetical protein
MGRKWTQDDVHAYNIKVVYQDLQTFFGVIDLPPPNTECYTFAGSAQDLAAGKEPATSYLHGYLDRIAGTAGITDPDNRVTYAIGFVSDLFDILYYTDAARKREVAIGPTLRYLAGQGRPPKVDVCIMHDFTVIILVVRVKRHSRGFDPEPRLISDTIAAFHNDNIMRVKRLGTEPLTSKVMPGIVMDGSMPTFYKIPVTPELVRAVESGKRPEEETVVYAYRPEVPRPEEGMRPVDNRQIILSCFEAFRQLL